MRFSGFCGSSLLALGGGEGSWCYAGGAVRACGTLGCGVGGDGGDGGGGAGEGGGVGAVG